MCQRSKAIIPGLLRRINHAEEENKKLKLGRRRMSLIIIVLFCLLIFAWLEKPNKVASSGTEMMKADGNHN